MPPKQRFSSNKGKGHAESSCPQLATHPWPRPEHEPFSLSDGTLPPLSADKWDQRDAYYYNQLLKLKLEPTRFMCEDTLKNLGIYEAVQQVLCNAQCMSFALEEDVLYPDLTRQCLATATLTYADPENPSFDEATFSFFAGGTRHDIAMEDFCIIYGFHHEVKRLVFPKKFTQSATFWDTIASGPYKSNSASQNSLRHPALRICARIFSNMLFNRTVGNKVHLDELLMLFLGCGNVVGNGNTEQFDGYRANLGIRFAEVICAVKDGSTGTTEARTERIGSLLTPLFRHHRIDLSTATCVTKLERMDTAHLISSKILRNPSTYRFVDGNGTTQFCELPNPMLTQLLNMDDLRFLPPTDYLTPPPARCSSASARASTSRAPEHLADDVDMTAPYLALPYYNTSTEGEFDLPPISDDPDTAEYRRWMIESQRKNNSLMQRIMQTLSRGCCHTTAATDAQPRPSNSTSGSTQPLHRRKRRARGEDDDTATTR